MRCSQHPLRGLGALSLDILSSKRLRPLAPNSRCFRHLEDIEPLGKHFDKPLLS